MQYGQGNNGYSQQPVYFMNQQPTVIPGLKVAYGVQAVQNNQTLQAGRPANWLERLKNTVVNLVTEEAEEDRPIGISQLSRSTFFAHGNSSFGTMVQSSRPLLDYRFRFIAEPRKQN
ncbi:MAG TPA: hypothetical protein V6C99_01770 [Oculatellaceae cyanobacterium]|jgi:hypothetical protein